MIALLWRKYEYDKVFTITKCFVQIHVYYIICAVNANVSESKRGASHLNVCHIHFTHSTSFK